VATHKSAEKAHRQTIKRHDQNRQMRTRLRTALRAIRAAVDSGDTDAAKAALRDTFALVDKMAGKGIIHRNTAGRYKSRITRRITGKSATA
jgi:small subunit ribosomal protein S20